MVGTNAGRFGLSGRTGTKRVVAIDPLAPLAPVLTWDTDGTDNTPSFTADFDDTKVVAGGSIDGLNYDVIHLQYSTASDFTGASTATNTLDAAEVLAGTAAFTTGTLADGTWYARCRHEHVVAGVSHFSGWSNTVSQTILTTSYWGLEDASGKWLLEDSSGGWQLEA